MKVIMLTVMVVLPQLLLAETDCWIEEYPDHYVAECTGVAAPDPISLQSLMATQPALPAAPVQTAVPGNPAKPSQEEVPAQVEAGGRVEIGGHVETGGYVETGGQANGEENAQRQARMSKSRLNAVIGTRNRLLQQVR